MASLDLECRICPSKPNFSDQSHLLTHISSKGHLSHQFKTQVRSGQDEEARQRLQSYEKWYRDNNIETLLAQRLSAKDSKTGPRRAKADKKSETKPRKVSKRKKDNEPAEEPHYDLQSGSVIDPSLQSGPSGPLLPAPQALRPPTAENPGSPGRAGTNAEWRAPIARMQVDDNKPISHSDIIPTAPAGLRTPIVGGVQPAPIHGIKQTQLPQTPTTQFVSSGLSQSFLQSSPAESGLTTSIHSSGTSVTSQRRQKTEMGKKYGRESAILKGTKYPGMDLFDTASEDGRRRRNQKKDEATLLQMQIESENFQPTEFIYFYPSWDLKKSRFISGDVESSPEPELEGAVEPSKRAPKRVPLGELEPNVYRAPKAAKRKRAPAASNTDARWQSRFNDNSDAEVHLERKVKRDGRAFNVYKDSPVKTEQAHSLPQDFSRMTNPFQVQQEVSGRQTTQPSPPYYNRANQSQGMFTENTPFLDSGSLFDRPIHSATPSRGSSVFRLDEQTAQTPLLRSTEYRHANYEHVPGPPLSQERWFTTDGAQNLVHLRSSAPTHMDMALAFANQRSSNPFSFNHHLGSHDGFGYNHGQGYGQPAHQEAPIDLRHIPRYGHSRPDQYPHRRGSSEETIDQGISESQSFFGN